jgi:hypothetical protein
VNRFELALFVGSVVHAPGETLLVPLPEDERPLGGDAGRIDWRLRGEISQRLVSGYITGKIGEATLLPGCAPLRASRILLLGVGPCADLVDGAVERVMGEAARRLGELRSRSALLALPSAVDLERVAWEFLRGLILGLIKRGASSTFRLVVPDAGGLGAVLEGAMATLLGDAHAHGVALEVGWVTAQGEALPVAEPA